MSDATPVAWRDHLNNIIRGKQERKLIAVAVNVNPATLKRWAKNETSPHWDEARALAAAVPELQPLLLQDLLSAAGASNTDVVPPPQTNTLEDSESEKNYIPTQLYTTVLQVIYEKKAHFLEVCNILLPQALRQLDPNRFGMEISLVTCIPPTKEGKVRSLWKCIAVGTPPWRLQHPQEQHLLLGAESLVGYVVMKQMMMTHNITEQSHMIPLKPQTYEVSAAAFPLMRYGRIAGGFLVASTQTEFTPDCLQLISAYTQLISLAFSDKEFYDPSNVDLAHIPWEKQQELFTGFRKRVTEIQNKARAKELVITTAEAECLARKQIEEELLRDLPPQAVLF